MDLDFEFSDRVLGFETRSNELFVLFQSQAAEYVLSAERDNFCRACQILAAETACEGLCTCRTDSHNGMSLVGSARAQISHIHPLDHSGLAFEKQNI